MKGASGDAGSSRAGLSGAARASIEAAHRLDDALRSSGTGGIDVFRAIVQALALPPDAEILDIGCGAVARGSTLGALAGLAPKRLVGLEKHAARIDPPESLPPNVEVHRVDAAYWQDGRFDLICLDLDPEQVYESLALIAETLPRLLKACGWVVARIPCRSRSGERTLRDLPASSRLPVERFLIENFNSFEPDPMALAAPLAAHGYETVAVVPARFARSPEPWHRRLLPRRWRRRAVRPLGSSARSGLVGLSARSWLVLRRREAAGGADVPAPAASYRLPRGAAFRLDEVVPWLAEISRNIGGFLQPDDYFARLDADDAAPASLLKHDIHHDLRRALRMAAAEAERGVFGVYFMMGPSRLNEAFFDLPYTWEAIRRIHGMGHSIGFHVDVLDTIAQDRDLYRGIAAMLGKFAAEGIPIAAANCHGNTNYLWAKLNSHDFFRETRREAVPDNETFGPFVGAYSFAEIRERFGIRYWLDSQPNDAGRIKPGVLYVSDNSSSLATRGPRGELASAPLDLDEAFRNEAAPIFGQTHTLVLLHPQFYE